MSIKIVTDSAADLPQKIIDEYGIKVMPLMVMLDDQVFKDGDTIKAEELFQGMREGKVYKTSQASVGDFVELFSSYIEQKQDIIYIAFSSALSGTYQSAVMAKIKYWLRMPESALM